MKKHVTFLIVLFISTISFSQSRQIETKTNSDINFKAEKTLSFSLTSKKRVEGHSRGWKFVPIIPMLGHLNDIPGLLQSRAKKMDAVKNALEKSSNGTFLVDIEMETHWKSFLWTFWTEKLTVTGFPAKLD